MKIKHLGKLSFLAVVLFLLIGSCNKEESFDYASYEPVIKSVTNNFKATPMIGRTYSYKAVIRGGSTYQWTLPAGVTVTSFNEEATAYVYVTDQLATGTFTATVTETTANGKVSPAVTTPTITVTSILPFSNAGITGDLVPLQGFDYAYTVKLHNDNDKLFSTFAWSVTDGTVTVNSKETYKASIKFATPGTQTITITETNAKGLVATSVTEVEVLEYCALDKVSDFVGLWYGEDALYASEVEITAGGSDFVNASNFAAFFMEDWWGETITESVPVKMSVNQNGTVTIARQYIYTTDYKGTAYRYEIIGAGRWNNCGAYPTLSIKYDIYLEGDAVGIAATYSPAYLPFPYLTAEIQLGGNDMKSVNAFSKLIKLKK